MTEEEFKEILDKEETDTVEFKSWINARNMKEIISLAVDELIAFANTKGGTVYFGVEDNPIEVTGCDRNYNGQRIIEGIYDRTVPPLFTEISDFEYQGKLVIAISVKADGKTYTTTDGIHQEKHICTCLLMRAKENIMMNYQLVNISV